MTIVIPAIVLKLLGIVFFIMMLIGVFTNLPDNPKSSTGGTIGLIGFFCFLVWAICYLTKGLIT